MNPKSAQSVPEYKAKKKRGAELARNVQGGRFQNLY